MLSRPYQYMIAGIFAFCSAFLTLPLGVIEILKETPFAHQLPLDLIGGTLTIINMLIYLYIYNMLLKLFNEQFNYAAANLYIYLSMILSVMIVIWDIGHYNSSYSLFSIEFLIDLILTIALGIATVMLAIKVKSIPEDLYGYKTLLFGFMLATGICTIGIFTCILIPPFLIAGIGTDIFTGLVLLKAMDAVSNHQRPTGGTNV